MANDFDGNNSQDDLGGSEGGQPSSEPPKYTLEEFAEVQGVFLPSEPPPREEDDKGPPKPRVAFYITLTLLAVFAIQVLSLTFFYLLLVSSVFIFRATDAIEMELVTEAILQGVQVIVPVTTTLLGVAIGYYFKEEADERAKAEAEDEDENIDL